MVRGGVRVGVHRDGGDAETLARAKDTARDFAAIGDEQLGEHGFLLGPGGAFVNKAREPSGER